MPEQSQSKRSVVMLTADRQIDRRILLEADSLETAGWAVTIVAMPLDTEDDTEDVRIVRLSTSGSPVARENLILRSYRWVRRVIPMNGAAMRALKTWAWRYLVDQEAFFTRLFADTAARFSPDVFVAHDLPMLAVARQHAARCGAKLVYDSHELYCEQEFSEREKLRWAAIEARHIGACDAVITVNASISAELEKRYGIRNVGVIHNADRTSTPPKRARLFHSLFSLPDSSRILLLQGGLSAGRNLESLVEAMVHVRDESIVLVILGDGALSKILATIVRNLGLGNRVFLHPAVPQADLPRYTVAADAGVIPYQATCLNNHYCTPNKLFEFIAAGLPILASDLPEIRRMVEGRDIGLVGDMSKPQSIARLIEALFQDKARFSKWMRNASSARQEVCWEIEGSKLVAIYEAL
ncbi:glycosyltransferase [Thauera sp. Sel9]|uniref:glycosyltransferase n=1 Tax=Thauera sp. Sel9 TaxID=2974299 RepID=UPI0021E1488E|nr:glycosyltransferase [Thauera sp. Sel9]MCV2218231.1 glycosyltransferase [Thauera sp. Sel9]